MYNLYIIWNDEYNFGFPILQDAEIALVDINKKYLPQFKHIDL